MPRDVLVSVVVTTSWVFMLFSLVVVVSVGFDFSVGLSLALFGMFHKSSAPPCTKNNSEWLDFFDSDRCLIFYEFSTVILSHSITCKNQGGKGLFVVVVFTFGIQAKCTSTYFLVFGHGSPNTSELTGIAHILCPSHLEKCCRIIII